MDKNKILGKEVAGTTTVYKR